MSHKKTLVSGIKPTGKLHIGNYFGAIRQFVEMSNDHESFVFIADLHALTSVHDPAELNQNILDVAIDYLALGLDPKKSTIFLQSAVPAHAELGWIFNCITTMPYLMRAHAFKDAEAKNKEINVGIFGYPLLMAADILLYSPDVVPVGNDQKQHVEIARDTAQKFEIAFGEGAVGTFKLPEALIINDVGVVPGTDGQKMSKSYNNTIGIFATDEEIKTAVMKIPTDSKGVSDPKDPETCKVFALHKLFATESELTDLRARYTNGGEGGIGYKESKEILIASISRFISPLREKRTEIAKNPKAVVKILSEGSARAREVSEIKMDQVRRAIGTHMGL
jgi:tryptophanyl-tRNA synthetase